MAGMVRDPKDDWCGGVQKFSSFFAARAGLGQPVLAKRNLL
jgi:hypothetical protein